MAEVNDADNHTHGVGGRGVETGSYREVIILTSHTNKGSQRMDARAAVCLCVSLMDFQQNVIFN